MVAISSARESMALMDADSCATAAAWLHCIASVSLMGGSASSSVRDAVRRSMTRCTVDSCCGAASSSMRSESSKVESAESCWMRSCSCSTRSRSNSRTVSHCCRWSSASSPMTPSLSATMAAVVRVMTRVRRAVAPMSGSPPLVVARSAILGVTGVSMGDPQPLHAHGDASPLFPLPCEQGLASGDGESCRGKDESVPPAGLPVRSLQELSACGQASLSSRR
mmetsp:Transcript_30322/g.66239  ORF Transcript_30322/g.66239 Transcript_30322/m.66239 type:complete len:222 (-) Transcript_30322:384-1049(-)